MKNSKMIAADQIAFVEVTEEWMALKLHQETFIIDRDTLYDLAFRSAAFLAFLEEKDLEKQNEQASKFVCPCSDTTLH